MVNTRRLDVVYKELTDEKTLVSISCLKLNTSKKSK